MQISTLSIPESKPSKLLSLQQQTMFERDGFLILKNFIEQDVCELLIERARQLINNFDEHGLKTIFSSKDQQHSKNLYFLDSHDKIRFFFEEGAFDENGCLLRDKLLCINKIGHALHELDPVFNCFSRMHKIAVLVENLNVTDPLLVQSMYICKQPYIGGEVLPHQDSTYLYAKNEPPVMGLWFALEDATLENGCLWAIQGGHKLGLKSRMTRDHNDKIATEIYDNTPWPMEEMIPLEVPRGSLIVLHGLLPHMSKENFSSRSRHAYALHVVSARAQFAENNWLKQSKEMPFKGFI